MRKLIFIFFLTISVRAFSQDFQGTLTYEMGLEVSSSYMKMGITKEKLIEGMKKDGHWADKIATTYKQGNYFTDMKSDQEMLNIYRSDSNKIFAFVSNELVSATDASIDKEEKFGHNKPMYFLHDTSAKVGSVLCKIVRIQWESGYYDYYFNSDTLKMSPELYSKHIFDGWSYFLKISNSLPLKIVKSVNGIIVTATLETAEKKEVNDKLFDVKNRK